MWDMDIISWTCECEWIFLEYFFDINRIFEEYDLRCNGNNGFFQGLFQDAIDFFIVGLCF